MFVMNYDAGEGWRDARIISYAPVSLDPVSSVFHYVQECFEGLKAYRTKSGHIQLFRPDCNAMRLQNAHKRIGIPEIPRVDLPCL